MEWQCRFDPDYARNLANILNTWATLLKWLPGLTLLAYVLLGLIDWALIDTYAGGLGVLWSTFPR